MKKFIFTMALLTISVKTASIEIPFVPDVMLPEVVIHMNPVFHMKDFLHAIGHKESGNNYNIVNTLGYLGRYQFGKSTLEHIGITLSEQEFLGNPQMQEVAMHRLLKRHKKILKKEIEKYSGTVFDNINITESGILAAAHLGGAGTVQKYFKNGKDKKDNYGSSVTEYMEKFGGYRLELN